MENIVIDFSANTNELTKAIDLLVKLGQVDQKTADEFKKSTQAYNERKKATDEAAKSTEELGKKTEESAKKSSKAVKETKGEIDKFGEKLVSIGERIAAAFAIHQVIAFGVASVKAFQEAEKNAHLLQSAVSVNGGLQSDFEELIKQSERLQQTTIFSDDKIQQVQTAALQFGLTRNQVEKLLPVITDFASATGQDLQSALDGVLQGINGMGRGLKIYGVGIDEAGTRESRLADITDQLTKKFAGQAQVVGETAFGATEKYKNQLDDLQEQIGKNLQPILLSTLDIFNDFIGGINLLVQAGADLVDSDKSILNPANWFGAADGADEFNKKFKNTFDLVKEASKNTSPEKIRLEIKALFKEQASLIGDARTNALATIAALQAILKESAKVDNGFDSLAAKDKKDKLEKDAEARKKANDKTRQEQESALKELNADAIKFGEEALKAEEQLLSKKLEIERQALLESEKLKLKKSGTTVDDSGNFTGNLKGVEDFQKAVLGINQTYDDKIVEAKEKEAQEIIDIDKKILAENVAILDEQLKANLANIDALKAAEINAAKERATISIDGSSDGGVAAKENLAKELNAIDLKYDQKSIDAEKEKADEIDQIGGDSSAQRIKIKQDENKLVAKLRDEDLDNVEENAKKELEARKALQEGIISAVQQTISLISQAANNYYQGELDRIEENKNKVLESNQEQIDDNERLHSENKRGDRQYEKTKNDLLKQREAAEKKADKERRKLIHEQAVLNRDLAIANAIINTAVGATAQFQAGPVIGAVLAALIIALGAVEIGIIASTPIPSYYKGVEKITGKGTETSDEVQANLSVGERVVRASTNRKFFPILSAIHHERFDPEAMNNLVKLSPETLKALSQTDPQLLKELATMQPVFLKHIDFPKPLQFRSDIPSKMIEIHQSRYVSHETKEGMNEHDMARALDRGTKIKNVKELAKEIGKEIIVDTNLRRAI